MTHLNLGYAFRTKAAKQVRLGLTIYNLFDARYESNGYGYSYMYKGERYDMAYYFPQAPIHVLGNVTVRF